MINQRWKEAELEAFKHPKNINGTTPEKHHDADDKDIKDYQQMSLDANCESNFLYCIKPYDIISTFDDTFFGKSLEDNIQFVEKLSEASGEKTEDEIMSNIFRSKKRRKN